LISALSSRWEEAVLSRNITRPTRLVEVAADSSRLVNDLENLSQDLFVALAGKALQPMNE